jgi:hypothetical protein
MSGFIYRRAVALKEFGERHNLAVFIRLGLWIRERVVEYPAVYFI